LLLLLTRLRENVADQSGEYESDWLIRDKFRFEDTRKRFALEGRK
jgi:hypothetical protein